MTAKLDSQSNVAITSAVDIQPQQNQASFIGPQLPPKCEDQLESSRNKVETCLRPSAGYKFDVSLPPPLPQSDWVPKFVAKRIIFNEVVIPQDPVVRKTEPNFEPTPPSGYDYPYIQGQRGGSYWYGGHAIFGKSKDALYGAFARINYGPRTLEREFVHGAGSPSTGWFFASGFAMRF